jgi:hypothetical protein
MTECPLCGIETVEVDPEVFVHYDAELSPVCVDDAQTALSLVGA